MIIDNKGKMFEDRRTKETPVKNGKRKEDNQKIEEKNKKKK